MTAKPSFYFFPGVGRFTCMIHRFISVNIVFFLVIDHSQHSLNGNKVMPLAESFVICLLWQKLIYKQQGK